MMINNIISYNELKYILKYICKFNIIINILFCIKQNIFYGHSLNILNLISTELKK